MDWNTFKDFGLAGLVIAALLAIIWRIIVWAMGWFKTQSEAYMAWVKALTEQQAKEREIWFENISKIVKALEEHTEQARGFHNSFMEANRYVRDEHQKMIEQQNIICAGLASVDKDLKLVEDEVCKLKNRS